MIKRKNILLVLVKFCLAIYTVFISYLICNDIKYNTFSTFKYAWIYFLIVINIFSVITFFKSRPGSLFLILSILTSGIYLVLVNYPLFIISDYYFIVPDIMKWIFIGIVPGIIIFFCNEE